MDLGNKIIKYRKKAGLSQEELGYKLNVTRQSVSLWENNQAQPTLENLMSLSEIFNVSIDELCGMVSSIKEELVVETEQPLFKANTIYTIDTYKNAYKSFYMKHLLINYLAIILSVLIFVGLIISEIDKAFCIIPLIFVGVFITYILRVKKSIEKASIDAIKLKPNLKMEYSCEVTILF